ncbi:MAG: helix-turn-helix domain-containing protein [Aliarcobacter sp.]|jgi:predicted DNA-binding transcriptional regulator AlpA|nr:helix-turn-helix domain-containing protein [Aliarcobacter sp.]
MIDMENINLIKSIAQDIETIKKSLSSIQVKRWLNTNETAKYLGYSKDRIYKLKEDAFIENLHFYKKTGKILFDRVAIDDWVVGKENNDLIQSKRHIVDNILSSIKKI